ncbi:MAG: hypothetical protein V4819_00990 [Verrucomicrobiota bacterium]
MIPPPLFGPLMATPPTGPWPVQFITCPKCGESYGVIHADLVNPRAFKREQLAGLSHCRKCFPAELFEIRRETTAQVYELFFQFSAAAG